MSPRCEAPLFMPDGVRTTIWPRSPTEPGDGGEGRLSVDSLEALLGGEYEFWQVTTEGAVRPRARAGRLRLAHTLPTGTRPAGTLVIGGDTLPVHLELEDAHGRLVLRTEAGSVGPTPGASFYVFRAARLRDRWELDGRWIAATNQWSIVPRLDGVELLERESGYFCAERPLPEH